MNIVTLLDMAASGNPDRVAVGRLRSTAEDAAPLTYPGLLDRARAGAGALRERGADELVYLGVSGNAFAQALFASAWAGIPLVPLNYRLGRGQLAELLRRHSGALVVSDLDPPARGPVLTTREWDALCARPAADVDPWQDDQDATAILLYTSGTTSAPKAAVLRHRHLTAYLLGSVEFGAADEADTMLVSVPPYHIAGVSNLLSNVYAGRRIVYLETFTPDGWLESVRDEGVTHALLVPTMLARLTEHLAGADVPTLSNLAYGGAKMPAPVLERATRLFPDVDFVNAYGLTETSSTIAVLGPDDHRAALTGDPVAKARLGSVGRLLPGIEAQVRGPDGAVLPAGRQGQARLGRQAPAGDRGAGPGPRRRRPARRRNRRRLRPGRPGLRRVPWHRQRRRRRRLAGHPRPRLDRRRGLPVHRGPRRRHDHPRRRERGPGRDRGCPPRASGGRRGRRRRHPRRAVGPGHRGRHRAPRRPRHRRGRAPVLGPLPPAQRQDPRRHRLPRLPPAHPNRQAPPPRGPRRPPSQRRTPLARQAQTDAPLRRAIVKALPENTTYGFNSGADHRTWISVITADAAADPALTREVLDTALAALSEGETRDRSV